MSGKIKIFDELVRTKWFEEEEKWYFSVIDVVATLSDSTNPYWRKLK